MVLITCASLMRSTHLFGILQGTGKVFQRSLAGRSVRIQYVVAPIDGDGLYPVDEAFSTNRDMSIGPRQ